MAVPPVVDEELELLEELELEELLLEDELELLEVVELDEELEEPFEDELELLEVVELEPLIAPAEAVSVTRSSLAPSSRRTTLRV